MALTPGTRLGAYDIVALIGAGGMGEVYRARDSKLNRDVALKVLPDSFANDPERLARFQREAQVLASLNHPNIGGIYGLEDAGGVRALVLELVEGPTLADRIAQGAVPLDDALPIARQIAEALEAAHEHGVIHRDLKPANIKVRDDGTVKVLDFGLAKALAPDPASAMAGDFANSPTITSPALATHAGIILGTAAYMSPEQAKGRAADKRSDVWAFGGVLYEMLTARRAFEGEDVADTLATVLKGEPDWNVFPPDVPPHIRALIRRCLTKDRKLRIPDLSVVRFLLDDASSAATVTVPSSQTTVGQPDAWRRALPWAVAGAAVVAAGTVLVLWAPWRQATPAAPVRMSAELGSDVELAVNQAAVALSPDGAMLAFVAARGPSDKPQLYIRRLDQLQPTPLAGTEGAFDPFFSNDGQWIGFFADSKLKKISVTGGAAVTLCDAPNGRGGAWADDGSIVFQPDSTASTGQALSRVSSAGGNPELLTTLAKGEFSQRWPEILPGSKAILYTSSQAAAASTMPTSSFSRCRRAHRESCSAAAITRGSCGAAI